MLVQDRQADIKDTLNESFVQATDGFWYPVEASDAHQALVRVQTAASGYSVERRRNARNPWMPIATATLAEFDAEQFRAWRTRWAVVQARNTPVPADA